MRARNRWLIVVGALVIGSALVGAMACNTSTIGGFTDGGDDDVGQRLDNGLSPDLGAVCKNGVDRDKDGYGVGCAAGPDCDDTDPLVNPAAQELCDYKDNNCNNQTDEGVQNACGTCDPGCQRFGTSPFPVDKFQDPNVKDVNGVGLDNQGDIVLKKTAKNFNYMWIANTFDTMGYPGGCNYANNSGYKPANDAFCRGTISKVDTKNMKEVARYFTVTCNSKAGASGCVDLHGKTIDRDFPHAPSRTAVDYNFDVWVANRGFNGQPSATKVANDTTDCLDRNKNNFIDTSRDVNGDGKITIDCNGDGKPDDAKTVCSGAFAGMKPEFYGDDDECILFTVNYGDASSAANKLGDVGRSICLDAGIDIGASSAWVGTYYHDSLGNNRFFRIDGKTGKLTGPFNMPAGHYVYGCVVDANRVLWSVDINGTLGYLNTVNPTKQVGTLLKPTGPSKVKFYGIGLDSQKNVWLGGYDSYMVYRYRPDRTSWSTLGQGKWTWIKQPSVLLHSRGIAADNRGKIWVAINNGYIFRINQNIGDGYQDLSASTSYWPVSGTTIIGVGVDFAGNVWGISFEGATAARLDVDSKGDPILPATAQTKTVAVGKNPYTYSDFTGYGLQNFTRPQGRYLYQFQACKGTKRAKWGNLSWKATTPTGTTLQVRARSGDTLTSVGPWYGPYQQSPVDLSAKSANPIKPNPALYLQVEFTLTTTVKNATPILHDFAIGYSCIDPPQ